MPRQAGLLVPLFSCPSSRSWGIGEFPDLAPLTAWMGSAGFTRLMLLPITAVPPDEASPYSAWSAMALEERHVAWHEVDDFARAGGEPALPPDLRDRLEAARASATLLPADVAAVKQAAARLAFESSRVARGPGQEPAFDRWAEAQAWWLDDYALFRALGEASGGAPWWHWEASVAARARAALADARHRLASDVRRHQYVQWVASAQWEAARAAARRAGVALFGDLAFGVAGHSADAWAHPDVFRRDVSVGAPPDAFSDTGQNWHLPFYDWPALERSGYDWIGRRVQRMAALFDGLRIDHLVGLYRTYGWPEHGEPFFSPADEQAQRRQGEAVLALFLASGLAVIAEDLGTVPDFVRGSMAGLGVPGTKVLRWERRWHEPQQPFIDPATFPAVSAAMTGTHDTEPLAAWWESLRLEERALAVALPGLARAGVAAPDSWSDQLRDAFLDMAFAAGSDHVFVPWPDLFGWRVRINVPGTIGDHNWTWRLPWPVDGLEDQPEAVARARWCRERLAVHDRW